MESTRSDLREASFSSYLTHREDNFVLKLTDQSVQFTPPANRVTSSQEISLPPSSERTKADEGEISVFGAERYFNMKLDDDSPRITDNINAGKCVREKEYPVDLQQMRPKSRLGTPSVTSEASWNSQAALIPNSLRNSSPTRHQKVNERWFLSGFPCSGSCSDKKSVDTDKDTCRRGVHGKELRKESARTPIGLEEARKQSQSRSNQVKDEFHSPSFKRSNIGSKRRDYFVLPCVNSGVQNLDFKGGEKKIIEDDPRKSLEVFGSHLLKREDIALNLERKLSVLTWDAIPKAPNFPTTSTSSQMYEDIESDGSSDLCMTPTSRCYEPSESSIEWSVVTASAAGFSAVSVDYDEKILAGNSKINPGLASTAPRKSRPNGLLGCKNQKAVDVAEAAYKRNDKAKSHHLQQLRRTDAAVPPRKLQANENIYGETS
uniref:Protein PHYTOCHROME KINASE SUBSTRATE 1-like n=1 Tax=Salix viminalis TaxID=40686 RepID=A0A6N2LX57_SALVM